MDVIYLFRDSAAVQIPFSNYDPNLFRLFIRNGGFWDGMSQKFIFRKDTDIIKLSRLFSGAPFVFVQEDSSVQPQVFGFIQNINAPNADDSSDNSDILPENSRWPSQRFCQKSGPSQRPSLRPEKSRYPVNSSPFTFPAPFSPPEKFSGLWRSKLEAELRSRKYSPRTQKAYIYYNRLICRTLQKPPEEIRSCDITQFLADMDKNGEYSASSLNLAISAIKFFFRYVLKKDDVSERHRPHQDGRLPMILSKEEISKILGLEKNPKHRLLLMLAYSSGLRVSEVVALKREHIDLSRKVIYVRLGKGRKDRNTILSEKAAHFIEEYFNFFQIEKWLFPGQPPSHPLSIRSAQYIFDKALRHAEINKKISIHNLRHTFATHLLESGTDIRYIQSLLGHANLRTTERYTHVARRSILNIRSPLDTI